jgi:predicted enzyme related to lactoylglutathione lyase
MATTLGSVLLSSTDPKRLFDWYLEGLSPTDSGEMGTYRVLTFDSVHVVIDTRADVGDRNPEPGRLILNFEVDDAKATVATLDELGTTWLAELEDRDGSLFATATDPDGNYVQLIQLSDEARAAMR